MTNTTQNLIDDVRAVIRDTDGNFVADTDILMWLNEAYLDLGARLRLFRAETTGTLDSEGTVAVPNGFIELVYATVQERDEDTAQTKIDFVDDVVFDSYRLSGDPGTTDNPGTATWPGVVIGRIFAGTLETFPVCASQAYTLRYVYTPDELDVSGSNPASPAELDIRLVNYARAHAKYKEGELPEGDRYMRLFAEGLPTQPRAMMRERPGPSALTPAPSYFDWA